MLREPGYFLTSTRSTRGIPASWKRSGDGPVRNSQIAEPLTENEFDG